MTDKMLGLQIKAVCSMYTLLSEVTDQKHRECLSDISALVSELTLEVESSKTNSKTNSITTNETDRRSSK